MGKALMRLSCTLQSSHRAVNHSFHKTTLSCDQHCDPTRDALLLGWWQGKLELGYDMMCALMECITTVCRLSNHSLATDWQLCFYV